MSAQPVRFLEPVPDSPIAVGATLTDLRELDPHAVVTDRTGGAWIVDKHGLWECMSDRLDEPTEPPAVAFSDDLLDWHGPITIRYQGVPQ